MDVHGEEMMVEEEEDDPGELASLSLFRRISFAPDGSHICGTNATLRGKNIAAMISREGWGYGKNKASSSSEGVRDAEGRPKPPSGAASLVGHKQPVVASRHCPVFFAVPKKKKAKRGGGSGSSSSSSSEQSEESESSSDDDDPDAEPEYATLVALGDKSGLVTVWSTKDSRPLFKMHCSESRCTVTDISWGLVRAKNGNGDDSLVMIVSLLDGYVVALHFDIPTEVGGGRILSAEKTRQIFRLKYGIDDFVGNYGFSPGKKRRPKKRLVDDAGPMLIENALQLTLEMEAEGRDGEEEDGESDNVDSGKKDGVGGGGGGQSKQSSRVSSEQQSLGTGNIKDKQVVESTKSGKKRIRPVLMSVNNDGGGGVASQEDNSSNAQKESGGGGGKKRHKKTKDDSLQDALEAASKAASVAEGVMTQATNRTSEGASAGSGSQQNAAPTNNARPSPSSVVGHSTTSLGPSMRIPYSTNKIFSVNLTAKSATVSSTVMLSTLDTNNSNKIVADCTNSTTSATSWPSSTLTISQGGVKQWKDIIVKAKCTALAANDQLLVVGTADGCLYLYGTSSTLGWESGKAYRAFPPFVLGSPVVEINITRNDATSNNQSFSCEMVVVTSDGHFYVYTLLPSGPKLNYKGSVVPAMQHMYLSSIPRAHQQPKMARIQITDSNQLMLILVLPMKQSSSSAGVKSLQGFIYNRDMELWMRVSDSNSFLLSDFYSSLPGTQQGEGGDNMGILAKMDRFVRSSSSMASAKQMYQKVASENSNGATNTSHQKLVTRSHCEDRLACAIALGSALEFQTWLKYYARCLSSAGDADGLRFLVDIFLGGDGPSPGDGDRMDGDGVSQPTIPSFLSVGKRCLGLEGKDIIRKSILPEMSKNRILQRLTNEISMELACL
ncbi:hypothetical protein ACHAXR_004684 [Thalassiosira sp. AJA248-18]